MNDRADDLPTPDCLPVEDIGVALERGAEDPARAHVARCPRCRALATELAAFRTDAGRTDDVAVERLRRALRSEIFGEDERAPVRRPSLGSAWRPVLAAAAVLLLVVTWARFRPGPDGGEGTVLRGAPAPGDAAFRGTPTAAVRESRGVRQVRFLWNAQDGADSYRIEVFDVALGRIAEFDAGADTTFGSAADPDLPEEAAFWRVVALDQGDALRSSRPQPLPEGPPDPAP